MSTATMKRTPPKTDPQTAEVVAALQKLQQSTLLPDPTRVSETHVAGTYNGPEPPDMAGVTVLGRYVPEDRILRADRDLARQHVDRARRLLGLPHIEIRWFEVVTEGPADIAMVTNAPDQTIGGVTSSEEPRVIKINAGVHGPALIGVIAHEVRHVQQHMILEGLSNVWLREADADLFAKAYVQDFAGE